MTAINPARLKIQAAEIASLVDHPQRFISQLHDLLAFYSERVRQTSLSKTPLSLQTYQTPAPVMRALEIEFAQLLEDDPQTGFSLAKILWSEHWVEFRQLGVFVLGSLPISDTAAFLSQVESWLDDCSTEDIRRLLLTRGLERLAAEHPQACLDFTHKLIESGRKQDQQAAIYAMDLLASNRSFLNLPPLYRFLDEIFASQESSLVKEISALLRLLIQRSEQETAFFLVQQLAGHPTARSLRVIRQVLKDFSPENQEILREKLAGRK